MPTDTAMRWICESPIAWNPRQRRGRCAGRILPYIQDQGPNDLRYEIDTRIKYGNPRIVAHTTEPEFQEPDRSNRVVVKTGFQRCLVVSTGLEWTFEARSDSANPAVLEEQRLFSAGG